MYAYTPLRDNYTKISLSVVTFLSKLARTWWRNPSIFYKEDLVKSTHVKFKVPCHAFRDSNLFPEYVCAFLGQLKISSPSPQHLPLIFPAMEWACSRSQLAGAHSLLHFQHTGKHKTFSVVQSTVTYPIPICIMRSTIPAEKLGACAEAVGELLNKTQQHSKDLKRLSVYWVHLV